MIRDATSDDLAAVRDVYRRSSLANERDRENLLAHPDALRLPSAAIAEQRTRVAVGNDGRILGFASIQVNGDDVELEDLFVDPERMRQGVGRELVSDLVARARSCGCRRVEVTVNEDALAFYESVGFVHDGVAETRFGPAPRMHRDL